VKRIGVVVSTTIEVDVDDRATPEDVRAAVERVVNRFDDGRHGFDSEMIRDGVGRVVGNAGAWVAMAVVDRLAKKYPALDYATASRDDYAVMHRRQKLETFVKFNPVGGWTGDLGVEVIDEAELERRRREAWRLDGEG
jgi:hypothetical protein